MLRYAHVCVLEAAFKRAFRSLDFERETAFSKSAERRDTFLAVRLSTLGMAEDKFLLCFNGAEYCRSLQIFYVLFTRRWFPYVKVWYRSAPCFTFLLQVLLQHVIYQLSA